PALRGRGRRGGRAPRRRPPGGAAVKVLVTGHHGYIGSVVAPLVAEGGHDVVGLDTFFYRGCDFGPEVGRVDELARDIRDVAPADLAGFDAVVHRAARAPLRGRVRRGGAAPAGRRAAPPRRGGVRGGPDPAPRGRALGAAGRARAGLRPRRPRRPRGAAGGDPRAGVRRRRLGRE